MSKGLWIAISLLGIALAWFISVAVLYKINATNTNVTVTNPNLNTKIIMDLDKFKGFHHDAQLLLEKLSVLKAGLESGIATKDSKLLTSTVNNVYRTMDSVSTSRVPTIEPFEVCDEALENLSVYAIAAKTYYASSVDNHTAQIDKMKNDFDVKFAQCQNRVNDKPVAALYQDYQ